MAKRPNLANLGERIAKKPTEATAPAPATEEEEAAPRRRGRAKTQPDGRRGVLVRLQPEAWKALKLIALEEDETLQAMMERAINDLLKKHGRPPLA